MSQINLSFKNNIWFVATENESLSIKDIEVYADYLHKPCGFNSLTYAEYFASPEYGARLLALVKERGIDGTRRLLGLRKSDMV